MNREYWDVRKRVLEEQDTRARRRPSSRPEILEVEPVKPQGSRVGAWQRAVAILLPVAMVAVTVGIAAGLVALLKLWR